MAQNFKRADELTKKIKGAMFAIKSGSKTPQTTGIGTMFKELKEIDEAAWTTLIAEYAALYKAWEQKQEALLEDGHDALTKKVSANG